jgi:hypothetical protein
VDVHWQKTGVTSNFQRNVFETQLMNLFCSAFMTITKLYLTSGTLDNGQVDFVKWLIDLSCVS